MRFSIHFSFMVMAFVAAFFAGRVSLMPVIREHQRLDVLQNQQIDSQSQQIQTFEKARALEEQARLILEQNRKAEELRSLDTMMEMESARSSQRIKRPQFLGPGRVSP
jgi:hypothetical protein